MNTTQNQRGAYSIVVGIDYSELGDLALEKAYELAQERGTTDLHVVHVHPRTEATDQEPWSESLDADLGAASKRLREHVENVVRRSSGGTELPAPFRQVVTHLRSDGAPKSIAQLASDVDADLIIVGTHGRKGVKRWVLGSVAEATVRHAACAVLVVRPPDTSAPDIEPPCPACAQVRRQTNGAELWCEQHREHHDRRHTYHYRGSRPSHQSGLLIHS